jgi:Mn2+/Fe2+ NRAMP family transporter
MSDPTRTTLSQPGSIGDAVASRKEMLSVLLGAAFLMATSAIGPGFLTQTAVFTDNLKPPSAFAILASISSTWWCSSNLAHSRRFGHACP